MRSATSRSTAPATPTSRSRTKARRFGPSCSAIARAGSASSPADGQHVLAFGSLEVYAQRGEYQLVVELLEPRGLGALQLAFEQRKARLGAEGLFEAARKRQLPRFPRKIGIATSPSGAALRDMLRVLGRRFAGLHIVIAPCRVQGEGAAAEITQAIADLNALGDVDVIIVGRGGGSLEDLWAFNEEAVARAIAGSKVPVVSAVGHEVDFTIADFVADLRAPTPSAAAEVVVREKRAVAEALADVRLRLARAVARPLRDLERRVDQVRARLDRAADGVHRRAAYRVDLLTARLRAASPYTRLGTGRHRLERLEARLHGGHDAPAGRQPPPPHGGGRAARLALTAGRAGSRLQSHAHPRRPDRADRRPGGPRRSGERVVARRTARLSGRAHEGAR